MLVMFRGNLVIELATQLVSRDRLCMVMLRRSFSQCQTRLDVVAPKGETPIYAALPILDDCGTSEEVPAS